MIYPLSGMLLGLILGVIRAKLLGGKGFDMAQWGAVFAIIGGLIGLFILIMIERSYV
jgi:hypothetical protein